MRKFKRSGALVALALVAGLLVPGQARAATTYQIKVGQDFFEQGVPGFSARMYPGSIKVQSGDTLHFDFGGIALLPKSAYPQEWLGENWANVGDEWFYFQRDPDDGPRALKFNEAVFAPGSCGSADNPCEWDGNSSDLTVPAETEDFDMWVKVTAAPGTTLWGASGPFPTTGVNFKVEVVAPNEAASTQAELDTRAAQLIRKDYEDALALHNKMKAKQTSHINAQGQKVHDVWVGGMGGPIELFASYPRRVTIPKGGRVQFHFQTEVDPHTATFGGAKAREMLQTGIFPFCDPDGDEGPGPDTMPMFGEQGPVCADPTQMEFDVDDRFAYEAGNGVHRALGDYENSGLKFPLYPESEDFDMNPWTVRFRKESNKKGFKYICLLHGGFMGGRVRVR